MLRHKIIGTIRARSNNIFSVELCVQVHTQNRKNLVRLRVSTSRAVQNIMINGENIVFEKEESQDTNIDESLLLAFGLCKRSHEIYIHLHKYNWDFT